MSWQARTLEMLGEVLWEEDRAGAQRCYERAREFFASCSPKDAERIAQRLGDLAAATAPDGADGAA